MKAHKIVNEQVRFYNEHKGDKEINPQIKTLLEIYISTSSRHEMQPSYPREEIESFKEVKNICGLAPDKTFIQLNFKSGGSGLIQARKFKQFLRNFFKKKTYPLKDIKIEYGENYYGGTKFFYDREVRPICRQNREVCDKLLREGIMDPEGIIELNQGFNEINLVYAFKMGVRFAMEHFGELMSDKPTSDVWKNKFEGIIHLPKVKKWRVMRHDIETEEEEVLEEWQSIKLLMDKKRSYPYITKPELRFNDDSIDLVFKYTKHGMNRRPKERLYGGPTGIWLKRFDFDRYSKYVFFNRYPKEIENPQDWRESSKHGYWEADSQIMERLGDDIDWSKNNPIYCELEIDNEKPMFYILRHKNNLYIDYEPLILKDEEGKEHITIRFNWRLSNLMFPEVKDEDGIQGVSIICLLSKDSSWIKRFKWRVG